MLGHMTMGVLRITALFAIYLKLSYFTDCDCRIINMSFYAEKDTLAFSSTPYTKMEQKGHGGQVPSHP
jgi:hypothetical protein